MLDPIQKTIEVQCNQQTAYEVFVAIDTWWPVSRFSVSGIGGKAAKGLRVDARVGGLIVEIGPNDEEHQWGEFKALNPFDSFQMDFHIAHPEHPVEGWTVVDVTFTAIGENTTRVELTQSHWEGLGEMAEGARGGYGKAWGMILDGAYRARCEG